MSGGEELAEAFVEIVELGHRLGVTNVKGLPGCWEVQVDAQWRFALNGHPDGSHAASWAPKVPIPPYHVVVEYNGFPAGIISPGGGIIAAGEAANEAAFIAALKAHGR